MKFSPIKYCLLVQFMGAHDSWTAQNWKIVSNFLGENISDVFLEKKCFRSFFRKKGFHFKKKLIGVLFSKKIPDNVLLKKKFKIFAENHSQIFFPKNQILTLVKTKKQYFFIITSL
jgi:hypothetical protein